MVDGARLLLVEDDAATREVLTLLLVGEGWAVEAAGSGEAALDLLGPGRTAPAVVLCDVHLPGVCGAALAGQLRKVVGGEVVLLAMTASVRADSGVGYDAVLGKPFAAEAVEAAWRMAEGRAELGDLGVGSAPEEERSDREAMLPGTGAVSAGGEEVLEGATVDAVRRSMGDAGARGFYVFALADAEERIGRMEVAVAGVDEAVFVREAHALKGSCGMVGARRLWWLASAAEREGIGVGSEQDIATMRVETGAVRRLLKTIFAM